MLEVSSVRDIVLPYPFEMGDHHNLIWCLLCEQVHYATDVFGLSSTFKYNPLSYDFTKGLIHRKELEARGNDMLCPSCGAKPATSLGRRINNFLIGASDGQG